MAVKHLFLALLSMRSMHGYELKKSFEDLVANQWSLNYGQVYTTLSRLERDGLITMEEVEQSDKPDKKVYQITPLGRELLDDWLSGGFEWNLLSDEMGFRFAAFQLVERDKARAILKEYRVFLLQLVRELTEFQENLPVADSSTTQALIAERNILKAEADLKWLDIVEKGLKEKS